MQRTLSALKPKRHHILLMQLGLNFPLLPRFATFFSSNYLPSLSSSRVSRYSFPYRDCPSDLIFFSRHDQPKFIFFRNYDIMYSRLFSHCEICFLFVSVTLIILSFIAYVAALSWHSSYVMAPSFRPICHHRPDALVV